MRDCRLCHDGSRKKFWLRKTSGSPVLALDVLQRREGGVVASPRRGSWCSTGRSPCTGRGSCDCAGQSTFQPDPAQPYQPQNQPSCEPLQSRTITAEAYCAASRFIESTPAQAAAGAGYISLIIMAPSGTGCSVADDGCRRRPVGLEPLVHLGRVPDQHRRMRAVVLAAPFAVRVGADPRPVSRTRLSTHPAGLARRGGTSRTRYWLSLPS